MTAQSLASLSRRAGGQSLGAGPSYSALDRINGADQTPWEREGGYGTWKLPALPPSVGGLSPAKYWNLPTVEGDTTDFNGIWDPRLDKSDPNVLMTRAQERASLSRQKEDQDIAAMPPDQRIQATSMQEFNHRMDGINMTTWDPFFEALTDAGEGGKQSKIGGFQDGPHDFSKQLGPNYRSIANDPKSSFNTQTGPYGAFGSGPATNGPYGPSTSQGGPYGAFGSGPATDGPYGPFGNDDALAALQRKGQYVDEDGHVQIRRKG